MAGKYLVVVDMQKDFVYGVLGSGEARSIVPAVIDKVTNFDGTVIFTKDTHNKNYLDTQEGKKLPVEHCICGTDGWQLLPELEEFREKTDSRVFTKETFGCVELAQQLKEAYEKQELKELELIGVCTDICVVSNALLLKAYMPELPVSVDASCCAGVTPEKHEAALETMQSCQIQIL